jgi:hypothetical protein
VLSLGEVEEKHAKKQIQNNFRQLEKEENKQVSANDGER